MNEITPKDLFEKIVVKGEKPWILDVRNPDEFAAWKIEGASAPSFLNIPYYDFIDEPETALPKVPGDKEWVVVCAKGDSSAFVSELLRERGIRAVNLAGGMLGWGDLHVPILVRKTGESEVWQVSRWGKGCLSYVVVAGGEAAVVDPSRHVDFYESFAKERGARVTHVFDTHVHADHLSGGEELARRTGGDYFVAGDVKKKVTARPEEVRIGGKAGATIEARVLSTPGHTPQSTSYLVDGTFLLSGDTLFVSGIGRPDLGGHAEEWGRMLFHTLHDSIAKLPPETVVLPAHFGSASEAGPGGVVKAKLGQTLVDAPELKFEDEESFVNAIKAAIKPAPETYGKIIAANLSDRAVDPEIASEWELGKNQCAASAAHA